MYSNSGPLNSYDASQCLILKLRLLNHRLSACLPSWQEPEEVALQFISI